MTYFKKPEVTSTAGVEFAYALANNLPIVFTRFRLGSGRAVTGEPTMVAPILDLAIARSIETTDLGSVVLSAKLDNYNTNETLHINEIGVFAKVGTRAEFLYMYSSAEKGDVIPPIAEAHVVRDYRMVTAVSTDSNLTIDYSPGVMVYATQADLNKIDIKVELLKSVASTTAPGLMSKEDKVKLNGIPANAQANRSIASTTQAEAGTDNTSAMTPIRTKEAITKQAMVVRNHGTVASAARPTGALAVYWIGSVEPTNATDNDLWIGG